MELEQIKELDEKIVENVTCDHEGLTLIYSDKDLKKQTMLLDEFKGKVYQQKLPCDLRILLSK